MDLKLRTHGPSTWLLIIVCFICHASWVDAQCEPCHCSLVRMPVISLSRAIVANCSGVDNFNVPTDLPSDLAVLDLSSNRYLRSLQAEDFHHYPDLKYILMQGNVIRDISADVFQNLTRLEIVDLSGTTFEQREIPEFFAGVGNLRQVIGLHANEIHENMFNGLERLGIVTLTIDAPTVPEMLFEGLTLHNIDLAVPNCQVLPARLFASGETSLRSIKIIGNKLTSFPEELFKGLTLLDDVYLEADMVHALPDHMLHGVHTAANQEAVDMTNMFLQGLFGGNDAASLVEEEESEDIYAQLRELTLVGIDRIGDHVLQELRNLDTLVIQHPLEIHPNAFADLPRLDNLEVSNFNLSDLNAEWFHHLEFLKRLNLSSNFIQYIDGGVLNGLHAAELLDLSHNNISDFTAAAMDSFRNFIKVLDLSHNNIEELPPSVFIEMYTLEILKLQGNKLKLFPSGLFTESSFYEYDTSQYRPEEDYYFPPMKDMTEINLSNNDLEEVTFYVFNQMGYLKTIDLSNNAITTVHLGNVPESLSMEMIDFRNNPLNCTCDLIHISLLTRRNNAQIYGTCESPASFHGTKLADLVQYADMCAPVTESTVETTAVPETTEQVIITTARTDNQNDQALEFPNLDPVVGIEIVHEPATSTQMPTSPNPANPVTNNAVTMSTNSGSSPSGRDAVDVNPRNRIGFSNGEAESDIFFANGGSDQNDAYTTTPGSMFNDPEDESIGRDAYIHYVDDANDQSNSENTGDQSQGTYDNGRRINENPFKFNRGSNLNDDKLQDLFREHGSNSGSERVNNEVDDTVDAFSGDGDGSDFENDINVQVPKQKAVKPEAVNGLYDYTWVKIVTGTLGGVGMVSGMIIFVVKMRGILYKWDYNTRRLWHF